MHSAEQLPLSATDKLRLGLLLLGPTILAFSPLLTNSYQFINLDDPDYVSKNPHVLNGLTPANIWWAFTAIHAYTWIPLTWISLQLDAVFFGSNPWGYHLTNVVLHAATVLMLAYALTAMTRKVWRSVMVALLFAVHPLRTESVAWIAERKDVLSGLFWMVTLAAYVGYARSPSWGRYVLVLLAFATGLLAKPMAVTLPFALLLLDFWPLRRILRLPAKTPEDGEPSPKFAAASLSRLIAEKVPLLMLSVAISVMTLRAEQGVVMSLTSYPLRARLKNALVSYVCYLGMLLYPADLALWYPHRGEALPWGEVLGAVLVLAAITAAVVWAARRKPYLPVGWFWYLGTLVPVIGLVQLTVQARADRFTYIPSIGLLTAAVWGISELAQRWQMQQLVALASGLLVLGWTALTWIQVHYWENSRILWTHTLEVTGSPNPMARNSLANAWLEVGNIALAEEQFVAAIQEDPTNADLHYNLGVLRLRQNKPMEAFRWFSSALELNPNHALALHAMGVLLASKGADKEAETFFQRERNVTGNLQGSVAGDKGDSPHNH